MMERSKKVREHTRPGCVPGVLAGHKARISFDELAYLTPTPRRLRPHFFEVSAGGDAGQLHARTRVLPKPRDGGFFLMKEDEPAPRLCQRRCEKGSAHRSLP